MGDALGEVSDKVVLTRDDEPRVFWPLLNPPELAHDLAARLFLADDLLARDKNHTTADQHLLPPGRVIHPPPLTLWRPRRASAGQEVAQVDGGEWCKPWPVSRRRLLLVLLRGAHAGPLFRRIPVGLLAMALVLSGGCASEASDRRGADAGGWEVTVYYTAVEQFHDGPPRTVRGCPQLECAGGDDDLGTYPSDFVDAVETEGTGRITSGPHAGQYLNWSHDVGFWLDSVPRDSHGGELQAFASAAADPDVLARATRFRVVDCGELDDGEEPPGPICQQLREPVWRIVDEFTPGLGGDRHVDLYIGEEASPDFTDSDLYTTLLDAQLAVTG